MTLTIRPVRGIGEIGEGADLAALMLGALDEPLRERDVLVVTSKVVSKAAGLVVTADREQVIDSEAVRLVARMGQTRIVRTRHGLTMAAAGVDASNTSPGTAVVLPPNPDASARELRAALERSTGLRLAVIITDTAGRPWRDGQTDIAIGVAGLVPLVHLEGRQDGFGNTLAVTAPAVADELAAAADLVKMKTAGVPVAVVSGVPAAWLDDDAPGATALLRDEGIDMFGLGSVDAVLAAVGGQAVGFPGRGADAVDRLVDAAGDGIDPALATLRVDDDRISIVHGERSPAADFEAGRLTERARILAIALDVPLPVVVANP